MSLPESHIKYLVENKCKTDNCYNFRWSGYVYCLHCLYDIPKRMGKEEIKAVKNFAKLQKGVKKK